VENRYSTTSTSLPTLLSYDHVSTKTSHSIDLRTYFALVLLTQPSSRTVPATIRKERIFVKTLGQDSEELITSTIVDRVSEVFEDRILFRNPEFDQWKTGICLFKDKVKYFVQNRDPIRFCLPAFPCKSSNLDKVATTDPDGAEFEALSTIYNFASAVREVYPPGCVVEIVSDGHVFSDCVGTDDDQVSQYTHQLQAMAASVRAQMLRKTGSICNGLITFQGLHEILFPMKWIGKFYNAELANVERILHPVNTNRTVQDNINRGLLLQTCNTCSKTLDHVVHENSESSLTLLYRGFSRFMLDDLKFHPDGQNKSKSQRKKLSERVALEMMRRNQAYSHLVELVMPRHVRLSIHAHNNSGPKFAVSLLPNDRFKHLASFDGLRVSHRIVDFEASHHLHIPTPWHNTLVQIEGDNTTYVCKSGLVKAELAREDANWLSKSGYVRDHERGGRYLLYRSEVPLKSSQSRQASERVTEDLYS
jgi:pyoverdine/dityrosine biosynthesis protein Dit1